MIEFSGNNCKYFLHGSLKLYGTPAGFGLSLELGHLISYSEGAKHDAASGTPTPDSSQVSFYWSKFQILISYRNIYLKICKVVR